VVQWVNRFEGVCLVKPFAFSSLAWALVALGLCLVASPAVQAAKLKMPLNDTGVNLCVDANDQLTQTCAGTGQDGETGRDVTNKSAKDGRVGFGYRKVCNSGELAGVGACPADPVLGTAATDWGCTKDKVTGLFWEIKTKAGLRGMNNTYTNWGDGRSGDASALVAAVNARGLCGATDWRLPTRVELQGVVDYGATYPLPAINTRWFPKSTDSLYWTADGVASYASSAWVVDFNEGVINSYDGYRNYSRSVRLVRADAAQAEAASIRFVPSGGGDELIDTYTGLIWRRCAEGQDWDGSHCIGSYTHFAWNTALAHAESEAGRTNLAWHVPNVKELTSLVNPNARNPAHYSAFPDTPASWFWTSTLYAGNVSYAWFVGFYEGMVSAYSRDGIDGAVRLVRTAQ